MVFRLGVNNWGFNILSVSLPDLAQHLFDKPY